VGGSADARKTSPRSTLWPGRKQRMSTQRGTRLEDMLVFARVVETGSLTKAAKGLGTTRSAVSKAIARLEDRLGARLLHRTTRDLSVTAAGQTYYGHCVRIAAEIEAAEHIADDARAAPSGPLRVACSLSVGLYVAPALPAFLVRFPKVALQLELSEMLIDLVREGIDVGIRLGHLPDSSLIGKKLAPYRRAIVASPTYLARCGTPKTPDELTRHNCLVRIGHEHWKLKRDRETISIKVDGNYRADAPEILRHAARSGLGIAMLPSYVVAADLAEGGLVEVLAPFTAERLAIYAVYPNQRHLPANVRAFVEFLAEALAPLDHSS
jgi:DNA-binding transcriptional LysR family regulator